MTSTHILRSEFIQYTGNSDVRTNLANYSTENLSGGAQKIHQNSSEKNPRNSALTRPSITQDFGRSCPRVKTGMRGVDDEVELKKVCLSEMWSAKVRIS
jgi:hypothetical protein